MYRDVILLSALIVVLFVIWLALKLSIRVRRAHARQIKGLNLASYVTFVNNFNRGEEAEKRGDRQDALRYYRRALLNLEEEENPDKLTLETIAEVQAKIEALQE